MVRSGVTSYRQLPVTLYQIRTKFRDEIRPRFGLMRGREFLMYDGYSFDADAEGLDRSYKAQDAAYRRDLRSAAASTSRSSQADSGAIGGTRVGGVHGARRHGRGRGRALRRVRLRRQPREGARRARGPRRGRTRRRRRSSRCRRPARAASTTSSTFLGITAVADDQVPRLRDRAGLRRGAAARRPRRQRDRAEERARRRAPRARLRGEGREGDRARRSATSGRTSCRAARSASSPTSRSATRSTP